MASFTKFSADFNNRKFDFQHGSVDFTDLAALGVACVGLYEVYDRVPPVKQFVDSHAHEALEAVKRRFGGRFSQAA